MTASAVSAPGFSTIIPPSSFDTLHEDLIHDAQLDYYGKRLATASSDRTIKIFEVEPNKPERLLATLSGHESPVWQVVWAHPKFGSLLASCAYDGGVIVWKESSTPHMAPTTNLPLRSTGPAPASGSSWTKVKEYRNHEASVNSISWSPSEFGLSLACGSSDGRVSVLTYQPEQSSWDVKVFEAHQIGCNAVSWCPSPVPESLFSISTTNDSSDPDNSRQEPQDSSSTWSERRLVTGGCDNLIKIWKYNEEVGKWGLDGSALEGHTDWVRDVAWAPNIGVPMHVIASCSQDKTVRIWKSRDAAPGSWSSKLLGSPNSFGDVVWRVSWSGSGNLLAVSCGDNQVTLWRETLEGEWECVSNIDQSMLNR